MATTRMIFFSIGILTIIPLIAFNIKRFKTKKEGEEAKINVVNIILVFASSFLLTIFLFTLYRFTLGYQSQLVLERFIRPYALTIMGEMDYKDFLKETEGLCTEEFNSQDNRCLTQISLDRQDVGLSGQNVDLLVQFQLGEGIMPKYYVDEDFFPDVLGVDKNAEEPIFMVSMIEFGGTRKFYYSLMQLENNNWNLDSFEEASEELVEYAYRYKLIRSEYSNKWYKLK